jgi:hypothetical protein
MMASESGRRSSSVAPRAARAGGHQHLFEHVALPAATTTTTATAAAASNGTALACQAGATLVSFALGRVVASLQLALQRVRRALPSPACCRRLRDLEVDPVRSADFAVLSCEWTR